MSKHIKACKCIEKLNTELEKVNSNTRVDSVTKINFATGNTMSVVRLGTYKADPKKRKPMSPVLGSYCPFCGEKYPSLKGKDTVSVA